MRYMLDTNIISDFIKYPFGKVANHIRQLEPNMVCTSIIVAGELQYGAEKKVNANLTERVNRILQTIPALMLDPQHAATYGKIRAELERRGLPIGVNDLWIAAHALAERKILVTNNIREFGRVSDLIVENWLE